MKYNPFRNVVKKIDEISLDGRPMVRSFVGGSSRLRFRVFMPPRSAIGSHRSSEVIQVTVASQANGSASAFMVAANRVASNDGAETLGSALQSLFKITAKELVEVVCVEELEKRIRHLSDGGTTVLSVLIRCCLLDKPDVFVEVCVVDKVFGGGEGDEDWSVLCFHVEVRFLG